MDLRQCDGSQAEVDLGHRFGSQSLQMGKNFP